MKPEMGGLGGVSVLVAGAGLAGLAAARDLMLNGADVTVVDARRRVGGRVWTIREPFAERQHAEAGGDLIDDGAARNPRARGRAAASSSRRSCAAASATRGPTPAAAHASSTAAPPAGGIGWPRRLGRSHPSVSPRRAALGLADRRRPRAALGRAVARRDQGGRGAATHRGGPARFLSRRSRGAVAARARRSVSPGTTCRRRGRRTGSTAATIAWPRPSRRALGDRVKLNTEVVAVSHRGREVRVSVEERPRSAAQMTRDYVVLALPATLLRRIPITPALPAQQHEAIARLKYGRATKTLLQFSQALLACARHGRARSDRRCRSARSGRATKNSADAPAFSRCWPAAARATRRRPSSQKAASAALTASLDWLGSSDAALLRVASDRLGSRSVGARRLRVLRSVLRSGAPRRGSRVPAAGCSSPASTRASSGRAT